MKTLNFEKLGKNTISFYLALEEYLLSTFSCDFFFLWDLYPAVVIGKHQLIDAEVNLPFVKEKNIKVYRRNSGGGAIYADEGCFMFTFITRNDNKEFVFKRYLQKIIDALKKLNIEAVFSGRNDLLIESKKFSGNSMYLGNNGTILHGTFLYNTDLDDLEKFITPDKLKITSKGIKSVRERVINVKNFTNLSKEELMNFLEKEIGQDLFNLSTDDLEKVNELKKKYDSDEWIYGANPKASIEFEKRFSWGNLRLALNVNKNIITEVNFYGDFIPIKDLDGLKKHLINQKYHHLLDKIIPISEYILNAADEDFKILLGGKTNDQENNSL